MRPGFLLLLALGACERSSGAPLIELSGVTPRRIELGDKLEIEGSSLPEGREAIIVLRGTLHRPGEAAQGTEIETKGRVVARDRIEVPVSNDLVSSFCGADALHTTFTGDVQVIFTASSPGAPPVTGSVLGAEIDVIPQGEHARRPDEAGERVLASLGIHRATEGDDGLAVTVADVEPGSRASRAGIAPHDRIVAFEGVRVMSPSDIALPPGAVSVDVTMTHGASATEDTVTVPTGGLAPPARSRVSLGLAIATLALAAIVAMFGPASRNIAWLERRLGAAAPSAPTVGGFAALVGAIVTLPLSRAIFGARVDMGLIVSTLFIASAALGASRAEGARDIARGWLGLLVRALPAIVALSIACLGHGSLSADDALRVQGALPWEWTAARSPLGLVLLAMMLAPWAVPSEKHDSRDDAAAVFAGSVAATLFLGGWRWSSADVSLLGVLCFAAKVVVLFLLSSWVRRSLPPVNVRQWLRVVVPSCLVVGALELLLQRVGVPRFAGPLAGAILASLATLIAVRSKRRADGERFEVDAVI
jgi:hypothetical protein